MLNGCCFVFAVVKELRKDAARPAQPETNPQVNVSLSRVCLETGRACLGYLKLW